MSVFLTVGSPALAGYSLSVTVFNSQWLAGRFSNFKYPNARLAFRVLSSLQQVPLRVEGVDVDGQGYGGGLLASLVALKANDRWWKELADGLDYVHAWSVSAAVSIAWVLIAYLFTVADSFSSIDDALADLNSNGESVGSVFLWLLPIGMSHLQNILNGSC